MIHGYMRGYRLVRMFTSEGSTLKSDQVSDEKMGPLVV